MRRLPLLLAAALLLAGCDRTSLPDRTVALGPALETDVTAPHAGTWTVTSAPAWLEVSPRSGNGPVALTLRAKRALGTPVTANLPALSGAVGLRWTEGSRSGTSTWRVTADLYRLRGQVTPGAAPLALDVVAAARARPSDPRASGTVIVKYREGPSAQGALAPTPGRRAGAALGAARVGVRGVQPLTARSAALRVADRGAALAALRADPAVEYAVPSAPLRALSQSPALLPDDQYAPLQWPYRLLGYGAVWRDMAQSPYTRPVTVAVVDSGVRYDHPDLAGQLWGPAEGALDVLPRFMDAQNSADNGDGDGPDRDPTDPSVTGRTQGSHGTHVTGIIAARWGDNGPSCEGCSRSGVSGAAAAAPVKVLPVRALDAAGNTDVVQVVSAVRYAAGLAVTLEGTTHTNPHPAQVINLSLGGEISAEEARPLCEAVADAAARGALVVAAAGNSGTSAPYYPAACPGAVAVASVTLSGASAPRHAAYSSAYDAVQLAAPGGTDTQLDPTYHNGASWNPDGKGPQRFVDGVLSTGWDYVRNRPAYEIESGTSQAAPQVSALAALLLSKGVTKDAASTLARMVSTATDLGAAGRDPLFGAGMVNAAVALGAPAVSDAFGLRLQNAAGQAFQPALDAQGRFVAHLPDGTYRVISGRDTNGNGVYGEVGEPHAERAATLGPDRVEVDVGEVAAQ